MGDLWRKETTLIEYLYKLTQKPLLAKFCMGGQSSPEPRGNFGHLWIKKIYDIAIFFQKEKKSGVRD